MQCSQKPLPFYGCSKHPPWHFRMDLRGNHWSWARVPTPGLENEGYAFISMLSFFKDIVLVETWLHDQRQHQHHHQHHQYRVLHLLHFSIRVLPTEKGQSFQPLLAKFVELNEIGICFANSISERRNTRNLLLSGLCERFPFSFPGMKIRR